MSPGSFRMGVQLAPRGTSLTCLQRLDMQEHIEVHPSHIVGSQPYYESSAGKSCATNTLNCLHIVTCHRIGPLYPEDFRWVPC